MTYTRPLQWVSMTTAVLACLWFTTALLDPFNIPKLAILVVGAAVLIGMLGGFAKSWFKRSEWPMWGGIGIFVLGLTAAAIASNQNLYRTLWGAWARNDGWLAYASLSVIMLAVAVAFRGRDTRIGLWALMGVGVFEVGYGLLQTTGHDPVQWANGYNPILGTVGNPDFASALLGICAVAFFWGALEPSLGIVLRAGSAVFGALAVMLTVLSHSVQGTLAYGAGFAVLIAGWLSAPERRASLRRLLTPYLIIVAIAALVAMVGLTDRGPLRHIMYKQNLVNRTYYWRAGWKMFTSHPIFGVGIDAFGDYYRIFRLPEQVTATGIVTISNAAHSIVFQMIATGGLAYFGTYVLLQAVVVWRGVVALRSGENRLLVSGLLGGWLAFLLQSLFSIDQLGLTVWGWVIGGLVIGVSYAPVRAGVSKSANKRAHSVSHASPMPALVASVVLGLGAVLLVSGPLSTDGNIRTVISYGYDTKNPNLAAQTAIKQAVLAAASGAQDPYWRAQAISKLYQIGAIDDGIKFAESSAKMFPMDATLWQLAATALEQTGHAKLATPWRARTVYLDPLNTDYAKLLASDKAAK